MRRGILRGMSDEIILAGKQYVSSKRASDSSGYAQDYIGQLARGGLIDAQRVGGLWYVAMPSLEAYQRNAADYAPVQPQNTAKELDTIVSFDGKDYISASRAAKITGYNQDYIGQLARGGKILSRQIGNRWYIEREGLVAHKSEKDALLAAVQSEAVGISKPSIQTNGTPGTSPVAVHDVGGPYLTYIRENGDLIPNLNKEKEIPSVPTLERSPVQFAPDGYSIPIHIVDIRKRSGMNPKRVQPYEAKENVSAKTIFTATKVGAALTIVIVLSYGIVTLKDRSVYTVNLNGNNSPITRNVFTASALAAFDSAGNILEKWLVLELVYRRTQ